MVYYSVLEKLEIKLYENSEVKLTNKENEFIDYLLEQETEFENISEMKFNFDKNRYNYIFKNKYVKLVIKEIVNELFEEHVRSHYLKHLVEFVEEDCIDNIKSTYLYSYFDDFGYELSYNKIDKIYNFKNNDNQKSNLSDSFECEIIELVKHIVNEKK